MLDSHIKLPQNIADSLSCPLTQPQPLLDFGHSFRLNLHFLLSLALGSKFNRKGLASLQLFQLEWYP